VGFTCNLCGERNPPLQSAHYENPELPSCGRCGSNVRFRWLVDRLAREFPAGKSVRGMGLTDPAPVAQVLSERFTYLNTFLDAEPRFDIRSDPSPLGELDFLIASEVFEHVVPPVSDAFRNAARLLKPSGVLLLTVPWVWDGDGGLPEFGDWKLGREGDRWAIVNRRSDGQTEKFWNPSFDGSAGPSLGHTREHFPELYDWELSAEDGTWQLRNRRRDGTAETFRNLVFHGGPGLALEMRLFTRADLENNLRAAGFRTVEFDNRERSESGIVFPYPWSHPVVARR
jgi:SAM-dependent methyltransferase